MSAKQHAGKALAWALLLAVTAANVAWGQDIAAVASAAAPSRVVDSAAAVSNAAVSSDAAAAVALKPTEQNILKAIQDALQAPAAAATAQAAAAAVTSAVASPLRSDYYAQSCPQFMAPLGGIVPTIAVPRILLNPGIIAGLIRLHFHDCFVTGCDASVLLDLWLDGGAPNTQVEKLSDSNKHMRPEVFLLLDDIKAECERRCPGKVSAADILTATTWTALKTIPAYWLPGSIPVPLYGRQDSLKSLMSDADLLPKSSNTPTELVNQFALKGFSKEEMTVLTGAHTIGRLACSFLVERLMSDSITTAPNLAATSLFINACQLKNSNGAALNPLQVASGTWSGLKAAGVTTGAPDNLLQMDPTFFLFTNDYFSFLPRGETWLLSDVRLAEDPLTAASMRAAAVNWLFKFGVAWTKLSNLLPDPATPGEVRPTCRCPKQATLGQCQTARGLAKY